MKRTLVILFAFQFSFFNFQITEAQVTLKNAKRIEVTKALDTNPDKEIMDVVSPYKASVDSVMAPVLGESAVAMTAQRPESLLSNWGADVMVWAAQKYFNTRVDMGLINIGGLRNNMPKGIVRRGDILLISPFQNYLSVLTLRGDALVELMQQIASVGGEGVSKEVRIVAKDDGTLVSATISGKKINSKKTYKIATLDYVAEGNDKMVALKKAIARKDSKTPANECMMEYIRKKKVISSQMEGRCTVEKTSSETTATDTKATAPKTLFVVHTNDTHSCIEPISPNNPDTAIAYKGGYMRRATLLKELRAEHPDLLLLDDGDFSQGSVYYTLFHGEVEVKLMNAMKYDAATIGNHEFDFGLDNMAQLFRMAQFPIVCCNYDFTGTPVEGLVHPYVIIERAGLKIGIFGVCPQLDGLVAKNAYGSTRYTKPISAAQPIIDHLRNEEKVDVVICLSHLGWGDPEDMDKGFIAGTTGIDLLISGHSHTYFEKPIFVNDKSGNPVPVNQMGKNARFVGTMELEVKPYSK